MNKVRFGLIGIGAQGGAYAGFLTGRGGFPGMPAPECPPHCALGALCDTDPAKEAMCKEKYPETPFFKDWKDLVNSGTVDAVVTTVPHYLHTEIAIYCLERGVAVLVEKPAGVYAKSVREMNECAAAHPEVPFGIMFNQRTNKLYQRVKAIVESGELGQIRRSNWIINSWWRPDSYYRQSDWRATWGGEGGGVLVNQALISWICGSGSAAYRTGYTQSASMGITETLLWRMMSPSLPGIPTELREALSPVPMIPSVQTVWRSTWTVERLSWRTAGQRRFIV